MSDIIKAIEFENIYLEQRSKGEYPFNLIDKIHECGFKGFEDYYFEKIGYAFSQLEFTYEECKPETCLSQVFAAIENKETKFLWMVSDSTFVFSCADFVNIDYCKQNDIPIYNTNAGGGTIVSTEGDVSFCVCVPKSINADSNFILRNIARVLRNGIDKVEVDGNDIMINGKKVLGSSFYHMNDMFALVAHMSFNDNSELISNICRKPKSGKTPSYVKNITQEKFRLGVAKWLQVQFI